MHDLTHRFFRKPMVILTRLDIFRSADFATVVLLIYCLSTLVPALPANVGLGVHFLHALAWRLFHSYGLGLLLRAQSKTKWLVRHYLKHYHYPNEVSSEASTGMEREGVVKRATEEAFRNWQVAYNISLGMTYGEVPMPTCAKHAVSFSGLAWKMYHLPSDWTVSGTLLRHILGFVSRLLQAPLTCSRLLRCTSGPLLPAMKSSATLDGSTRTFSSSSKSPPSSHTPASTASSTTPNRAWAARHSSACGLSAGPSLSCALQCSLI